MTMQDTQSGMRTGDSGQNPTIENVKTKLGELAEPVKEKAVQVADEKKNVGADQMRTVANAVHGAARELESQMPQVANLIHDAGAKIEQAASDIRNRNLDELFDRFSSFAREQPALVFGGAVLTGLMLSRFLKSSTAPSGAEMQGSRRNTSGQSSSSVDQSDYYG